MMECLLANGGQKSDSDAFVIIWWILVVISLRFAPSVRCFLALLIVVLPSGDSPVGSVHFPDWTGQRPSFAFDLNFLLV